MSAPPCTRKPSRLFRVVLGHSRGRAGLPRDGLATARPAAWLRGSSPVRMEELYLTKDDKSPPSGMFQNCRGLPQGSVLEGSTPGTPRSSPPHPRLRRLESGECPLMRVLGPYARAGGLKQQKCTFPLSRSPNSRRQQAFWTPGVLPEAPCCLQLPVAPGLGRVRWDPDAEAAGGTRLGGEGSGDVDWGAWPAAMRPPAPRATASGTQLASPFCETRFRPAGETQWNRPLRGSQCARVELTLTCISERPPPAPSVGSRLPCPVGTPPSSRPSAGWTKSNN